MKRITKASHARFCAALDSEMKAVGAVIGKVDCQPEVPNYTLETPVGPYTCHPCIPIKMNFDGWRPRYNLTVFGRFQDSERVERWLGVRRHAGKWNRHFGHHEASQVQMLATDVVTRILTLNKNDLR